MRDTRSEVEYAALAILGPRGYHVEDVRIGNGNAQIRATHSCGALHVVVCPVPSDVVVMSRSDADAFGPTLNAINDAGCYCVRGRPPGWDDAIDGEPDPVLREVRMLRRDMAGIPAKVRAEMGR